MSFKGWFTSVAALVAGCASVGTSNVDPAYRPGANGLLVASVSASGYNPGTLWLQVVRADAVTQTVASIPVNDTAHGLDWSAGDPAIPNGGSGRLAVVELAPGTYELRRWVINVSNQAAFTSVRPFGYRFVITPGKATYLGHVHVDVQRTAASNTLPFSVTLEDRRDRDLPIAYRKYRGLRPENIAFADPKAARDRSEPRPAPLGTRLEDLQGVLPEK